MNIALVMTAVKLGATVANKVEVMQLLKDADGKIEGARVKDNLTGDEWEVKARVSYISQANHLHVSYAPPRASSMQQGHSLIPF